MKDKIITQVVSIMAEQLTMEQLEQLERVLAANLANVVMTENVSKVDETSNPKLLHLFISAKRIEECSEKSLKYYKMVIEKMVAELDKPIRQISTSDLRTYLANYQKERQSSKVTIDNMRRIFSSFFSWLECDVFLVVSLAG